jgi:hypothetical protein
MMAEMAVVVDFKKNQKNRPHFLFLFSAFCFLLSESGGGCVILKKTKTVHFLKFLIMVEMAVVV